MIKIKGICYYCSVFLFVMFVCSAQAEEKNIQLGDINNQFTIVDATQTQVILNKPAQKIVILYAGFESLLRPLNKMNCVINRTDTTSMELKNLPSIGTHMHPNFEQIIALNPDLVLQLYSERPESKQIVKQLRGFGLNVAVFKLETFEDIFTSLKQLAILSDAKMSANELDSLCRLNLSTESLDELETSKNLGAYIAYKLRNKLALLDDVLKKYSLSLKPRVFVELRYPNLLGAGKNSLQHEIISRAGGRNVLETYSQRLVKLDEETLLMLDPELVIMQQGAMYQEPVSLSERPVLKALNKSKTLVVNSLAYSHPSLASIDAVFELAIFLHPELSETIKSIK
ncbi:ABC transporter substrate-binding protein [Desulfovibrio litoralis]|uniref:Iron complex transport system substrate-binding protein n=1 Tax=Desulfovibrio litoralis DSM 11393 TaxID=1121455 RepID=A0A1M7S758_9BACT|nr:ABC transporter substrate-binding protein [Desulfovibrio litoralis]SHN54253.1 iron complex transport system substrate-binding protein [Desulfovibrio litoralis DSM 11393]